MTRPSLCRVGVLHRVWALLALSAMLLVSVEPAFADMHDGDAAAADVGTAASHLGPGTMASSPSPVDGAPSHAFHVDHCAHAHGFVATAQYLTPRAHARIARIDTPRQQYASASVPPRDRPPIA